MGLNSGETRPYCLREMTAPTSATTTPESARVSIGAAPATVLSTRPSGTAVRAMVARRTGPPRLAPMAREGRPRHSPDRFAVSPPAPRSWSRPVGRSLRITRQVFHDLAIWMVAFGLGIGVTFPFFVMALGVPAVHALTPVFFVASLGAGALSGLINHAISRWVVGARLRVLASGMRKVESHLATMTYSGDLSTCTPDSCAIVVDSEDEIGDSAVAFNRLVGALAESMRTQAAVHSFSEMLTSHLEIANLGDHALRQFFEHTGAAGGLILYESGGELLLAASRGLRDADSIAASDHVAFAMKTGEAQTISLPEHVRVESVVADFRPAVVAVHPILYKGVPLGVLVLASSGAFGVDDQARIHLFLQGLGLALNNALVHERLQRLAALDALTGVYNRRFGLGRLHEEFGRAVRASTPLAVMMLDVDHFKTVNDTYGHPVGDRILKSVCAIARTSLREGDVLLRYGGEEFMIVLPAASAEDITTVGERLRRAVEGSFLRDGEKSIKVTISIGGAAFPDANVQSEQDLIALADEALYRAKEGGRNRVEIAK